MKHYTVAEFAKEFNCTPQTVRKNLNKRIIKGIRLSGKGRWKIPESEFDRLSMSPPEPKRTFTKADLEKFKHIDLKRFI